MNRLRRLLGRTTLWLVLLSGTAVLAGATMRHAQPFASNQNTKMLHGLALAGAGHLQDDWLANTTDPFPVWSVLVAVLFSLWDVYGFYVGAFVMAGLYALGLALLATAMPGWPGTTTRPQRWALGLTVFCVMVAITSPWFRNDILPQALRGSELTQRLAESQSWWVWLTHGDSFIWLRDWGGVAGQSVMSGEFQPATFGALIVLGLAAFAHRWNKIAAVLMAAAAIFHPTYLITTAAMMTAMLGVLALPLLRARGAEPIEGDAPPPRPWKGLLTVAGLYLLPTGLMLLYTAWSFAGSSPELTAEADAILAQFRIPHHALAERWLFDSEGHVRAEVARKLILVGMAVLLAWRWRLALPIALCAAVGIGLTWLAIATGSHRLMLIAPWRVSASLVPIALAIVIGRVAQAWCWIGFGLAHAISCALIPRLRAAARHGLVPAAHLALVMWLAFNGQAALRQTIDRYHRGNDWPLIHHVRESASPGDVYLVSANWMNFRNRAQVPIVITHKSHPIKDTEVLDWKARLDAVQAFDRARTREQTRTALDHLAEHYGVTRVVLPVSARTLRYLADDLPTDYRDRRYVVLRVRDDSGSQESSSVAETPRM